MARGRILNSWKEIGTYTGRGIRTIQRWNNKFNFPVHRVHAGTRSPVFAYSEEIDSWLKRRARASIGSRLERKLAARKEKLNKLAGARHDLGISATRRRILKDQFEQTRKNLFSFMSTDLDAAMTLARIAKGSADPQKKARNDANARRALETVLKMYRQSNLTEDERKLVEEKIARVKAVMG